MPVLQYPRPKFPGFPGFPGLSDSSEIVALGGDLESETLLLAYRQGIFPWPMPPHPIPWFCPFNRAILEWNSLHIPKSLVKIQKKTKLTFVHDRAFSEVIRLCAQIPRSGQEGTWITPEIQSAYLRLHQLGHAHSIEAWDGNQLVGGLYGVDAGGAFAGESMFHLQPHASKLALLHLMNHLHSRGLDWIDIQVMTPHLEALGAKLIPREDFLNKLSNTLKRNLKLFTSY